MNEMKAKLDRVLQIRLTEEQARVLREHAEQDARAPSTFARLLILRALELDAARQPERRA